jgi:hypothetical protein
MSTDPDLESMPPGAEPPVPKARVVQALISESMRRTALLKKLLKVAQEQERCEQYCRENRSHRKGAGRG